ncbi:hypothetical protein FOYG_03839 [Fusarium oxysporum NRRL 32931]|uniref:Uncharacterized protein n=1 Tax=Fusarium oxysporum NRRL 32931 TaxID=660029 RepID=W9IYZ2_FUSOX|nr:hypothetical protein FOYG_03839 [Fusarium oxysporum NRRL 32931]
MGIDKKENRCSENVTGTNQVITVCNSSSFLWPGHQVYGNSLYNCSRGDKTSIGLLPVMSQLILAPFAEKLLQSFTIFPLGKDARQGLCMQSCWQRKRWSAF